MPTTQTKKKALACRVSDETFNRVQKLTEGENPPFESISEYLYTVIISDLARRELGTTSLRDAIIEMLKDEEIKNIIKETLKDS